MNLRYFHGKIYENYGWELEFFNKYRNFSDGIEFLNLIVNWDKYESDHKPSFEIALKILNFIIFEFTIYNIWHTEDFDSPYCQQPLP